ncbi:MAG: hypothetical protein NTV34_00680, partial [Proteobacteria bacterium]|nr:hypothetical protein [Pseudomonadota bacterium]
MAEHWLSIVEYARTFSISDMTIRRRIRTGRIQAYLRDGKYYIPIDTDPVTGDPVKQVSKLKPVVSTPSPMKSHPTAERTIPQIRQSEFIEVKQEPIKTEHRTQSYAPQFAQIPGRLAASVVSEQGVTVEAKALLDYCNSSLATVKDIERHLEGNFAAKIETAKEQIKFRDAEIAKLNQHIEDLQLLVQIL